jgi:MYXO-CTERM domain-containing protein
MSFPVALAALLVGGSVLSGLLLGADRPTPPPDTGAVDTGAVDTGAVDTGAVDTGAVDTGTTDTGGADGAADGGADGAADGADGADGAADGADGAADGADGADDGGTDTAPPVEIDTEIGDYDPIVEASPKFTPSETGCGSDSEEEAAGLLLIGFAGLVGLGRRRRQRA